MDTVVHKLGPVNVVICNGMSLSFLVKSELQGSRYLLAASVTPPQTPDDILTIPADAYYDAASIGLNAFTAAQKALPSFQGEAHRDHPQGIHRDGGHLAI